MTIAEKIKIVAHQELKDVKHLPMILARGAIGVIFAKAGVPRVNPIPEEYFEAFKEAMCDEFCGGCEPEFEDEKSWKEWNNLNSTNARFMVESEMENFSDSSKEDYIRVEYRRSPYCDKTVPFLVFLKK